MSQLIYKVVDRAAWLSAVESGFFTGAEIDIQDGYIHLSSRDQVEETVRKHFSGRENLLLIEIDAAVFDLETGSRESGDESKSESPAAAVLRWEQSRNNETFPHLYAPLDVTLISSTYELPLDSEGNHHFPW